MIVHECDGYLHNRGCCCQQHHSQTSSSVVTRIVLAVVSSHTLLETLKGATDVLGLTLEAVVALLTTT